MQEPNETLGLLIYCSAINFIVMNFLTKWIELNSH